MPVDGRQKLDHYLRHHKAQVVFPRRNCPVEKRENVLNTWSAVSLILARRGYAQRLTSILLRQPIQNPVLPKPVKTLDH